MEPDVIEIPPPPPPSSRSKRPKLNQVIPHEVIDVDDDGDALDVMILDEKISKKNKGKSIEGSADMFDQAEVKEALANYSIYPPKSSVPGSHKPIIRDGASSDLFIGGDYMGSGLFDSSDFFRDDFTDFDEYAYLQAHFDKVNIPPGIEAPIPSLLGSVHKTKNTPSGSTSLDMGYQSYLSSSAFHVPVNSGHVPGPNHSRKKLPATSKSSLNHKFAGHLQSMPHFLDHGPLYAKGYSALPMNYNNIGGNSNLIWPSYTAKIDDDAADFISDLESKLDSIDDEEMDMGSYDPFYVAHDLPDEGVARSPRNVDGDDIMRKYQAFKQFDTVEDHADHHYASKGSSIKQPPKNWAKRIQEEWKILEKGLPDNIYVRVYESRMDLLRAVIIGAEGTPYHDGLFFFDVFFPKGYPNVPPNVHYHSGGLRLNPNLYSCGKVCLSLLGTWHGTDKEKWQPGVSTALQVLVSIQALILNQRPFFNEPGYETMEGSPAGDKRSQVYNEKTFTLSLKTMVYSMRRPPKHFEDFVLGHFHKYGREILVACKAYMEGAPVGSLVKGGIQDVEEGEKGCSKSFKNSLQPHVDLLIKEFSLIGVKNCEEFQSVQKREDNVVNRVRTRAVGKSAKKS